MATWFCPNCWHEVTDQATVCAHCRYALAQHGALPYEQKLMLALRHPIRENRMLAIQLLGELRSVAALDALAAILAEEPDYYVIREVAQAVARIGTERGHRLIESLERHSSPLVRRLARQLRNRPAPSDEP